MSTPLTSYRWQSWKIGLLVSGLTGLLMGVTTLAVVDKMSVYDLLILLAVNTAKDMLLYLKEHPVSTVVEVQQSTSPTQTSSS